MEFLKKRRKKNNWSIDDTIDKVKSKIKKIKYEIDDIESIKNQILIEKGILDINKSYSQLSLKHAEANGIRHKISNFNKEIVNLENSNESLMDEITNDFELLTKKKISIQGKNKIRDRHDLDIISNQFKNDLLEQEKIDNFFYQKNKLSTNKTQYEIDKLTKIIHLLESK